MCSIAGLKQYKMAVLAKQVLSRVEVSPEELADLFCQMNGLEQGEFFNHLNDHAIKWQKDGGSFEMQMQYVADSGTLKDNGRRIMRIIGDYSQPV